MNVPEFHNAVRDAAEKLQKDTGAFVSFVTIIFKGPKIQEISTQMGSTLKYDKAEGPNKDNGTDE